MADLLDLSAIEGRSLDAEPSRVDVAALAERLVGELQQRIAEQGFELELTAASPAWAWLRRQAVEQTLSNLLYNACSYTDPGGRIDVESRLGQGSTFSVTLPAAGSEQG